MGGKGGGFKKGGGGLAFEPSIKDIVQIKKKYGCDSHLGHVTYTIFYKLLLPFPWMLHMKFSFDWRSSFGDEDLCKWRTSDAEA